MEYCHFIYKSWAKIQKQKYEGILRALGKKAFENKNILDVGSGPGYFLNFLREKQILFKHYLGIDPSKKHILEARENIRNSEKEAFLLAKFEHLPINLDFFNTFLFFDVIHLINKARFSNFIKSLTSKDDFIVVISLFKRKANVIEEIKGTLENDLKHKFKIKGFALAEIQEEEEVLIVEPQTF